MEKISKLIVLAVCYSFVVIYSADGRSPLRVREDDNVTDLSIDPPSPIIDTRLPDKENPSDVEKLLLSDNTTGPGGPYDHVVTSSEDEDYSLNFTSVNNSELLLSLTSSDAVDLCFLVDITGSMGPYIEGVKKSIRRVVDQLTNTTDRDNPLINNLRLSFVGYRDFEDDTQFEILPFTPKVSKFLDFLNNIRATGGGDAPEDVFGGLEKVAEREWTESATRVLFHMADAPCHHPRCGEHTGQDPLNRTAEELFKPFRDQKVIYNFGQIAPETQPMIKWFQEAYGEEISIFDLGLQYSDDGGGDGFREYASSAFRASSGKTVGDAYLGAVLTSLSKTGST